MCIHFVRYLSPSGSQRVQERSELSLGREPLRRRHGLVVEEAQQSQAGDQIATRQIRRRCANWILSDDHVFHCRGEPLRDEVNLTITFSKPQGKVKVIHLIFLLTFLME